MHEEMKSEMKRAQTDGHRSEKVSSSALKRRSQLKRKDVPVVQASNSPASMTQHYIQFDTHDSSNSVVGAQILLV